jgi:hypothetical protein
VLAVLNRIEDLHERLQALQIPDNRIVALHEGPVRSEGSAIDGVA